MYSNDITCVKLNNLVTETFPCYTGVKQGCMLSPTLFNLFLSDLPQTLNRTETEHVKIDSTPVSCILYADDLVIVSKTAKGLQKYLDKLEEYSNTEGIEVNKDKTKVMIFNNNGHRMNSYQFHYKNSTLENVKNYKYLGLVFNTFGHSNEARNELKKVGLKALFKLEREMGEQFRTNPKLTMRLFDALVKPILLYGSEVWGIDNKEKNEGKDPAEIVHIKFCKMLLGVPTNASNNACRAELGRIPLKTTSNYRSIKFWMKLITSKTPKLSCKMLQESENNEHYSYWNFKIKSLLFNIGLGNVWLEKNYNAEKKHNIWLKNVKRRLTDIAIQTWYADLHNDNRKNKDQRNKLRIYRQFKTIYKYENYLTQVKNIKHRVALTKLRISSHKLQIERGRYKKPYTKPEDRTCPKCQTCMEDERHVFIKCTQCTII